ncbi:MAG: 30S ribosomal protein S16 [Bacteroidaceae bacterium]|nr:30S ribosomal protein S16 [Bacteroidaceae bacterium]MBO4593789.1 30S ribosomal protein S16 [Bacteroidaceae bacterium]MBR4783483.1 30S ribosomal protein S16 [Bacteroidaceae bacterium]
MATKIRLQRRGRKSYAFYSIVIADANAPRDGRFTEKIGTYNPNTNPATVDLNFDRALYWVEVGAQPTDTVRNILSREGVYLMKHLRGGVKKGAFDEAAAQSKFDAWKQEKTAKLNKISADEKAAKRADVKARLEAEKKVNDAIAQKVAEKKAAIEAAKAEALAAAAAEAAEAAAAQEAPIEAPEAPAEEATEAPAEEATEAPAEA